MFVCCFSARKNNYKIDSNQELVAIGKSTRKETSDASLEVTFSLIQSAAMFSSSEPELLCEQEINVSHCFLTEQIDCRVVKYFRILRFLLPSHG